MRSQTVLGLVFTLMCSESALAEATTPEPAATEQDSAAESAELQFSAFVDANYVLNTSKPGSPIPGFRAYAGASPAPDGSGYVTDNGFALNFAGLDAAYDAGSYGATLSLRFGPKVPNYHFNSDPSTFGIENVTQAYATWIPTEGLTLDFGMFGTIFGAEVLESWQNLNYTRGALYFAAQPFWHTGLRAAYTVSDMLSVTALVVNDANTAWSSDNPQDNAPVLALQVRLTPSEALSIALGGMYAVDTQTSSGLETFADLVVTYNVAALSAVLNADYNFNRDEGSSIAGVSLALGYQFTPMFGAALRGEYVKYDDGDDSVDDPFEEPILTGTATLDFKPVPASQQLVVRLEGRVDQQQDAFVKAGSDAELTDVNFMGVVSLVATTN